jgi:arginyl-tRNA--protein-N-Asp/Glu arginylyltransferase
LKHRVQIPLRHFFATPPTPCPYLPGRLERKVVTLLASEDPDKLHDALSQAGFRRSQDLAYRPACDECNSCVPVRVPVSEYKPNRAQRRVAMLNTGLTYRQVEPAATREHYFLFRRYILSRHAGGGMAEMDFADYRAMVEDSPVSTHLTEFRESDGRLYGICLTDQMSDGLSLVYSFFEPDAAERSPGTAMIMRQIEAAQRQALPFVYLGYWISESRKMAYKRNFRPLEALTPDGWRRLD